LFLACRYVLACLPRLPFRPPTSPADRGTVLSLGPRKKEFKGDMGGVDVRPLTVHFTQLEVVNRRHLALVTGRSSDAEAHHDCKPAT